MFSQNFIINMPVVMENQTSPEPASSTNESQTTAHVNGKISRTDEDGLCPYHHNVNKTSDGAGMYLACDYVM